MKFITNRILNPAGGGPTFDQWLEDFAGKLRKEASEAKPGLGMPDGDNDPRGQGRGQVINNDNEDGEGYQKGESVDGKKEQGGNARPDTGGTTDQKDNKQTDKEACSKPCLKRKGKPCKCAGKDMGENNDAGKVTDSHTDAAPTGETKLKVNINNDPCYQDGESNDPGKVTPKNKKEPGEPVVGKGKKSSSIRSRFTRLASANRLNKLRAFAAFSSNRAYHVKNQPLAYVEAMVGLSFANMTEEEKSWFKDFWLTMFDEDYVKEMVKDR